jgi:hypothetical protein
MARLGELTAQLEQSRGRTVSTTPKGLDFVRAGIAKALCSLPGEAERYAEQRWGEKSRAAVITKASVPHVGTNVPAGAALVSADPSPAEFFDLVRAQSVVGRLPLRRVPFYARTLTMDEGPRVGWRDEGAAYGTSPLKLTNTAGLERFGLGALVVVTQELLEDETIDAELIIRDQLVKALAAAVDSAFLDPANSGTAGVKPAAVTSGVGGGSPTEALFDFSDSFTGVPENAVIILNPWQAARLNGAARPNLGVGRSTWAGIPVYTSTAMPEGYMALLDPDGIAIALGEPEVRASREASVEMVDSSSMTSGSSVSAANQTSLFQVNAIGMIGSLYANWRVVRPGAVLLFNLQDYGLAGGL